MELVALVRDIAIIFMAFLWIVLLAVLALLALKVKSAVDRLPRNVEPLLDSAKNTLTTMQETAVSIKGTASFVNRAAATPVIRVAAIIAATTRFAQVLLARRR